MKKAADAELVKSLLPVDAPVVPISKRQGKRLEVFEMVRTTRDEGNQAVAFNSRPFILCGLPVRRPAKGTRDYIRRNGKFSLEITGHREYGLPFGQDRLIPIFLATMALRQKNKTVKFRSAAQLLDVFGLPKDGKTYRRLVEGFKRIATSKISFGTDEKHGVAPVWEWMNFQFFDYARLWFSRDPEQQTLTDDEAFGNVIVLSDRFWAEIQAHPVPVDLNVVRALADSPARLDFYSWLVWRCFSARGESAIPLEALKEQLGVSEKTVLRNFRRQLRHWLEVTRQLWPECPARLSDDGDSLLVSRSRAITPGK
jgi:hypothetical protein